MMWLAAASVADEGDAVVGRSLFRRLWVPAPTRTDGADGLGPLFNARSCVACHKDAGPSQVHRPGGEHAASISGAVFRVAGPGGAPHPWYGRQLQTKSVPGLAAEARARLTVTASGEGVRPDVTLAGPALEQGYHLGARIAPPLAGIAALDRVDEAAVLLRARPEEQRRLGLSGRARQLSEASGGVRLGRYGWKASQASIVEQTAEAFAIDLGLSSPLRPQPNGDCTPSQAACLAMPNGESRAFDGREVSRSMLDAVVVYLTSLGAAEKAGDGDGAAVFDAAGCSSCHVPSLPATGGGRVSVFTDLLLHDMGSALDDGVAEPGVSSSEWRTAPLMDLAARGGSRRYLHDGRAASIEAAVRWHGGEAARSRELFSRLSETEREWLVRYLEGR
jgi:CxxC motif-containing protein (DUF1111 family)